MLQQNPAQTTAVTEETPLQQPALLRIIAKLFSYVFHPLFIPAYIFLWLTWRFPMEFAGITDELMFFRKINVFLMTAFFPAFSVFLLCRLKFIDNIFLKTQRERIAPYMITMVFYWWMWYLSRNFSDQPAVLQFFYFGILMNTVFGLILNSFSKLSMHGMGMGGALACIILTAMYYQVYMGLDIFLVTVLTGAVCTARLLLNDHNPREVYTGLFIGIFCQLISYIIIM